MFDMARYICQDKLSFLPRLCASEEEASPTFGSPNFFLLFTEILVGQSECHLTIIKICSGSETGWTWRSVTLHSPSDVCHAFLAFGENEHP